jgi:tRNA(fMet)-specific endonuclease VapC
MASQMVLDTDILSAIMRRTPVALSRAHAYLQEHGRFTFSVITHYEILRGLQAKNADRQVAAFNRFGARSIVLPITQEVADVAAAIYGELSRRGELIGDADVLIAASARAQGLGVVSNNEKHFQRVHDLQVENWLR